MSEREDKIYEAYAILARHLALLKKDKPLPFDFDTYMMLTSMFLYNIWLAGLPPLDLDMEGREVYTPK